MLLEITNSIRGHGTKTVKLGFGFGNESMCVTEREAGGKVNTEGETEEFRYLGSKATDSTQER